MCIICNASVDQETALVAVDFLDQFERARHAMEKATADMLLLSQRLPNQRKQYDRSHKAMRALIRQWNNLEHQREKCADGGIS